MESEQVLDIPDWSQGPRARVNERWIKMIKQKTCEDIKGVSQQQISSRELSTHPYRLTEYNNQELCNALKDGNQKEFVLEVITSSVTMYFEHLRQWWKDHNDEGRSKRWEVWAKQSKRNQRVCLVSPIIPYIGIVICHSHTTQVQKQLTKDATLQHVNIWIERAALCLNLSKVKISEEDLPQDALSDLESDAEDVSHQEKMRYAKEAGLERVASKWMSWRKAWMSDKVSHCSSNIHRCKGLHIVISVQGVEGSGKVCCK